MSEMRFYLLDVLIERAKRTKRNLCAWRPWPLPIGLDEELWILDASNKETLADYEPRTGIDPDTHSYRLIIRPTGEVEGFDQLCGRNQPCAI